MTAAARHLSHPDLSGPRELSQTECRAWIAEHVEGRVAFSTGRGPRSVVIGYAVRDDEVLLVLPEYHPATGYLVGAQVTIEVEAATEDGTWECVRASGIAYDGAEEAAPVHPYGASWPAGVATHSVHVPLNRVEGHVRTLFAA